MKYYIIAGEASGDLHGSKLMEALKEKDNKASIRFWGGDLMQQVGGVLVKHYKLLAFMGFWEVITHLGTILKNIKFCIKNFKDIFHRDQKFNKVKIDNNYPKYILKNKKKLSKWIA